MPERVELIGSTPARPVVSIDGDEKLALSDDLLSCTVEETTDGLFCCEARFNDFGPAGDGATGSLYLDRSVLDFGTSLSLDAAAGEGWATIFEGTITGIEAQLPGAAPPSVTVLAEDALQELRLRRRTRTFEDVTDQAVAEQIASDHGLGAEIDVDGPTHRVLAQVNQSDLAFLRSRARTLGAEVWVADSALHLQPRTRRDGGRLELEFGAGLREFTVLADLAHQRSEVTVSGWDVGAKSEIEETASVEAIRPELNGGESGPDVLREAIGPCSETIVHEVPLGGAEARAIAEARFREAARRFVEGRGVAVGDGRIRVGTRLEIAGAGSLFDGEYAVTRVRHLIDRDRGYQTHFTVQRPYVGR